MLQFSRFSCVKPLRNNVVTFRLRSTLLSGGASLLAAVLGNLCIISSSQAGDFNGGASTLCDIFFEILDCPSSSFSTFGAPVFADVPEPTTGGGNGYQNPNGIWGGNGGDGSTNGGGVGGGSGGSIPGATGLNGFGGNGSDDGAALGGIGGAPQYTAADVINGLLNLTTTAQPGGTGANGGLGGANYGGGGGGVGVYFDSPGADLEILGSAPGPGGSSVGAYGGKGGRPVAGALGTGAAGGGGAAVIFIGRNLTINNGSALGGNGGIVPVVGVSGGGGAGVIFNGDTLNITNGALVEGGIPTTVNDLTKPPANAGQGGDALVVLSSNSTININAQTTVEGGGSVNQAGAGVVLLGDGTVVNIMGTVKGGLNESQPTMTGGTAIKIFSNDNIVNLATGGVIYGGQNNLFPGGITNNNAVEISGNNNKIIFSPFAFGIGNVRGFRGSLVSAGSGNQVILSGDDQATKGEIADWNFGDSNGIYGFYGFESFHKQSQSIWELWYTPLDPASWYIDEGTLQLASLSDWSLVASTTVDAILDISALDPTTPALFQRLLSTKTTGQLVLGQQAFTITNAQEGDDFQGVISGTGTVTIKNGYQTLSGDNTYSGLTTIAAGATLQIGNGGTMGPAGPSDIIDNGTLVFNASSIYNVTQLVSGTGNLQQSGSGIAILLQNNTYTGFTELDAGTLSVSADSRLGNAAGGLHFNGGTLQVTGTTMTATARTITWGANGGGFDIADGDNIFTVAQAITAGGQLTKLGDGTLILSGTNTYTGGTELAGGLLIVGSDNNLGSAAGGLRFNSGTLQVTNTINSIRAATLTSTGGTIVVDSTKTATFSGAFTNALLADGNLTKAGDGTLILAAQNSYTGITTITSGVLQLGNGVTDSSIVGDIVNNASLVVNNIGATMLAGEITGTGSLTQMGAGTLTISGDNSYKGDTNLNAGVISVNQDDNLGDTAGALHFNGGTLQVLGTAYQNTSRAITWGANGGSFDIADGDNTFALTTVFTGAGALNKLGGGALVLSGDSHAFTGQTTINAGLLRLHDGALGGAVNVNDTSALGGHGTISGAVTVADGATLFGQSSQVLNFEAGLTLAANSNVDINLHGAQFSNALFNVTGDLALNGTLNLQMGSLTTAGVYRIFDYSGTLIQNTMILGTVEEGDINDYTLQTSVDNQINLINLAGREFFFWDGVGPKNDGVINGSSATWDAADDNWTDFDGLANTAWRDDTMAVFAGAAGTVTIDAAFTPSVNGIQFATDGYQLTGGIITLTGESEQLIIVGDGSLDSASMKATISSVIQGTDGLAKLGAGTLVLSGGNTYTGVTNVLEGTLELGDGGSIVADSDIILTSTRYSIGILAINKSTAFTLANQISGEGEVFQRGTGSVLFTASNTFSGGLTVEKGIAQAGIADTAFGSGSVTVKSGATLDLADFDEIIGGLAGSATGDGNITLGAATLTLNQEVHDDFSGVITGTGGLTLDPASTGSLTLYGANTYTGATNVAGAGLIQGAQGALSSASAYSVAVGSLIDLGGFSTKIATVSNNGTISFGGTGGAVLTIVGDYAGNDGTLEINTVLAGDDARTDMLKVGGNISAGTTTIDVINRGGLGAQTVNGIKVIDVTGQSDGIFLLNGDYLTTDGQQAIMTSSAYAYTLQQNSKDSPDDGNWYLVSQYTKPPPPNPDCKIAGNCPPPPPPSPPRRYSAAAPIYESYTTNLQALNKLPTLQQRIGNRYLDDNTVLRDTVGQDDETKRKAVWARIEGGHSHLETGSTAGLLHQNIDTYLMQAGIDGQFYDGSHGKLIGGFTGQYGEAHSSIENLTGDGSGSINTQGWNLSGTLTWYGTDGLYMDGQAQTSWYDSDLTSHSTNKSLRDGNKGNGYSLSIEAGQRFGVNENWSLTPQAQLMWSSVNFDSFTDPYKASISNQGNDSLSVRIGLAANYARDWKDDSGRMVNSSLYGIANLYQEFMNAPKVGYTGTLLYTDNDNTWASIGAGGTYSWADAKYALYGEGSVNTSLKNFARSYGIKGTVGLRVRW